MSWRETFVESVLIRTGCDPDGRCRASIALDTSNLEIIRAAMSPDPGLALTLVTMDELTLLRSERRDRIDDRTMRLTHERLKSEHLHFKNRCRTLEGEIGRAKVVNDRLVAELWALSKILHSMSDQADCARWNVDEILEGVSDEQQ